MLTSSVEAAAYRVSRALESRETRDFVRWIAEAYNVSSRLTDEEAVMAVELGCKMWRERRNKV